MRPLTPLCELAIKYESDKGGRHLRYGGGTCHATHEYTPIYWDLMHTQKDTVKAVLEIGVNRGCSLRMWEEFFPNAQIIGLDIERSTLFTTKRISCFYADQNNPSSLTAALNSAAAIRNIGSYDLIIDDGSHRMDHQGVSMQALLPLLTYTGAYVIEDIPRDQGWADYLAARVPPGYNFGVVYPALAAGEGWPEQLFIVTREPT